MTPAINPRVVDTGTPPIPAAKAWLAHYSGTYGPRIDLSQAVPGEPPPAAMLDALGRAAADGAAAAYGPILGDMALREVYAADVARTYGGRVDPDDIAITAGCNLAFVVAAMALAKAGDVVLLPAPWYFNHAMTLNLLGVEPRALACRAENGFVPDADDAERLIDPRVRAVVLVTPNNPTGAIYPAAAIARFAELAQRRGLWLILDETYRDFLPDGIDRAHDLFTPGPEAREHMIQLYSFSKAYGIPSHRLGAMVLPRALVPEVAKILDCVQICAPRVPQIACTWAIDGLASCRESNRREIARRGVAFRSVLAGTNDWRIEALGAYFAYVRHPFDGVPAPVVAERLAVERGVLTLPGGYFGPDQDQHVRVAIANVGVDAIAMLGDRLAGFSL
jgi:aspartate/methionine/tyrosine aminotransferase